MKVLQFIKSLIPSFDRSQMLEDLDNVKKRLNELMPALENVAKVAGDRQFKNDLSKGINQEFLKIVKTNPRYRGNFYNGSYTILKNVQANIPTIEALIESYFKDEVIKEAMTLVRSNILQYLESITFAVDITSKLLLTTMVLEEETATGINPEDSTVTAGEMKYITERLNDYYSVMQVLAKDKAEIEAKFKAMPDLTIDSKTMNSVEAMVEPAKLDPFGFGFIGAKMNPIFHIRIAIAEYQTAKYHLAKETKQALELRLLRLQQLDGDKDDVLLQTKIRNLEARISDLTYKIKEMEDNYA